MTNQSYAEIYKSTGIYKVDSKSLPSDESSVCSFSDWNDLIQTEALYLASSKPFWLLAHLDYAVFWGLLVNLDEKWECIMHTTSPPIYSLINLRLFNASGEVFLWRVGFEGAKPQFRCRSLFDHDQTDEKEYGDVVETPFYNTIDEYWALWGTRKQNNAPTGWCTLTEDRGMKQILPIAPNDIPDDDDSRLITNDPRVLLKIRKYFDFDQHTYLAYPRWTRLVDLVQTKDPTKPYQPNPILLKGEDVSCG